MLLSLKDDRPRATIDFESRSACDLLKHGAWIYSKHETTEIMCLSYQLPGDAQPKLWHPAYPHLGIEATPDPVDLFSFIEAGGEIEAHNAFFERVMWANICVPRLGWPKIPDQQWRCSASKASACALPRALGDAANAVGLRAKKDDKGRRLMLKLSKPRKPRKDERLAWKEEHGDKPMPILWHESKEEFEGLWAYCRQDVRTEHALSLKLPDLAPDELALWQVDQWINLRGAKFDLQLARAALDLSQHWKKVLNTELEEMTGVSAATKRAQVKDWLAEAEGLDLPDTTAETLDHYLGKDEDEVSARAKRVLEIVKQVNRTSIRKYQSILDRTDPEDGRARDLLMFHGADTGRWSGKGIQIQNLPRGGVKGLNMEVACADVLAAYEAVTVKGADPIEELEWLFALYGDVMELLSSIIRGALISARGRDLMSADYSAIEARCVLWEAGAHSALEVFRTGGDIYCDMATGIYGYPVNKKDHPDERQFGKQAILGLGYGMGFLTFLLTCRKYDIHFSVQQCRRIMGDKFERYVAWVNNHLFPKRKDEETPESFRSRSRQAARSRAKLQDKREDPRKVVHELALMKYTVDVYRSRYPEVKDLWKAQEAAAIKAVRDWTDAVDLELALDGRTRDWLTTHEGIEYRDAIEGPEVKCGMISWQVIGGFLCCTLPSGRRLRYRDPEVKPTVTSWGEVRDGLRYWKVVTGNKWARKAAYGGLLVENITQAVARDIMSDAVLRSRGYKGYHTEGNLIVLEWDEPSDYDVIISVHDELVAEVNTEEGSLPDFENLMAETKDWASGCPIAAEATRYRRYRK